MTIVRLKKITLYGAAKEKKKILEALQAKGCVHIIPLHVEKSLLDRAGAFSGAREALQFMRNCPTQLKPIKERAHFDPEGIQAEALENKRVSEALIQESDALKKKIEELTPWGSFVLPQPHEIGEMRFWFYLVPHAQMKKMGGEVVFTKVGQDNRFCYVVVASKKVPETFPGARVTLDARSLEELQMLLKEVEFRIEDLHTKRIALTRWLPLFEANLYALEDRALLEKVEAQTHDAEPVFALQGWIPESAVESLLKYGEEHKVAVLINEQALGETPPTLLHNPPLYREGEDLISFYMTPRYGLWDPSMAVFFSFAVFFAMIFSDAGYALLLGSIVAYFWKKLGKTEAKKRFRVLLVVMTLASFLWGVLVGSYFGLSPPPSSVLAKLHLVSMQNYRAMMGLAIGVGVAHTIMANLALAWALRKSLQALASVGWALVLLGGALAFIGYQVTHSFMLKSVGFWTIFCGLGLVILFLSKEKKVWKRILQGFIGLTRLSGLFGDVLSYLRLFALGLASASLASVFNNLPS